MTKTKILIVGIGGVGGYIGGVLCKKFYSSEKVEIIFLARGNNFDEILKNGITIKSVDNEFNTRPAFITDNPKQIGDVDYIILGIKNYDLNDVLLSLDPCITKNTCILPLLNGVEASEICKKMYPDSIVSNGCIYIVSRLTKPGLIENSGNTCSVFLGINNTENGEIQKLHQYLISAGINAKYSENIESIVWEKFIFISAVATATCRYNEPTGRLLEQHQSFLTSLIHEVTEVAKSKNIQLPENIEEITLDKIKKVPYNTYSSMHADVTSGKSKNELENLTGFVVREGKKLHLPIPAFLEAYETLKV
jgi:2-dehydropantoate 2-reductase